MESSVPAAGWYPDPQGVLNQLRYWDGVAWTAHTTARVEAVPAPTQAVPVAVTRAVPQAVVEKPGSGKAMASLILGVVGLVAWFIPLFGLPICVTGLVLGANATKSPKGKLAVAGIVLCGIALVFTLVNMGAGVYLAATGQHPLVEMLKNGR